MLYVWFDGKQLCGTEFEEYVPEGVKAEVFEDLGVMDVAKLIYDNGQIRRKTEDELRQDLLDQMLPQFDKVVFDYLNSIAREYGYEDVSDVEVTASFNSPLNPYYQEAVLLRDKFYVVWNELERLKEEIKTYSLSQLQAFDITSWLNRFFQS